MSSSTSDLIKQHLNMEKHLRKSQAVIFRFCYDVDRAGASTTRVLVLPKTINMNILKTLYSSTTRVLIFQYSYSYVEYSPQPWMLIWIYMFVYEMYTLKTGSCYDANFVVTSGTVVSSVITKLAAWPLSVFIIQMVSTHLPLGKKTSIAWDNVLAPNTHQAIIWTIADLIHWRIYAALGRDELISKINQFYCTFTRENCLRPTKPFIMVDQGWGAVSDLSLISDLSQKFKHDL